jgi:type IX secretion system substrate protein
MRKITIIAFSIFFSLVCKAQTVFWTETFNNGCVKGCLVNGVNTGNGAWALDNSNLPAGTCNDTYSNLWFISCKENGNAAGACGSGCGAAPTLHIGANDGFFYDIGASYDAGGFGGCGKGGTYTYTRAVSPLISTVGYSGITVSYNYLKFGQNTIDDGWVDYSTDGGVTWTLLVNNAKTACCGGACNNARQGLWTSYTSGTLPAAADNNANVKLRFVWTNNDDGAGKDPSYAISDLTLSYNVVLPIELLTFAANYNAGGDNVYLNWSTATETNNHFFTIERSADADDFTPILTMQGAGNSDNTKYYSAIDKGISDLSGVLYYRLKQTDYDGKYTYSKTVAVTIPDNKVKALYPNPASSRINIDYYSAAPNQSINYFIYDCTSRKVSSAQITSTNAGINTITLDISPLPNGIYFLELIQEGETTHYKFIKE